jgi:hypothetical protein
MKNYYIALRGFQNRVFGNVVEGQTFDKNDSTDHMFELGYFAENKPKAKVVKSNRKTKVVDTKPEI